MSNGEKLIKLLGYYAAHEDSASKALFHERMERCIEDLGIPPLDFSHPMQDEILGIFDTENGKWSNVILAGEAGAGKTRLIHKVHLKLGGDKARLKAKGHNWVDDVTPTHGPPFRAHINRDLSAWRKFGAASATADEANCILHWSRLMLGETPDPSLNEFFVIAANDGQLLKAWKDHSAMPKVGRALELLEQLLRGSKGASSQIRLFHMSSVGSDTLMDGCIEALVTHPGWESLEKEHSETNDIFADNSPLRRNFQALNDSTIRRRLLDLAKLCDSNEWHLPVRNILAMLANALLGVSDRKLAVSGVLEVADIRKLMAEGRTDACNFFANIFGLNLDPNWRERILGPLESFRVGLETTNQADNLILFGPEDDDYRADHEKLFLQDKIFQQDQSFEQFRVHYLSQGPKETNDSESPFQKQLVAQRRRLFFRTPPEMEGKYNPWCLTNYQHGKDYLERLLSPSRSNRSPHAKELGHLVLALNRIWTGLLLDEQDQLFVTTALDFATGRSSEIEVRRIPTRASSGGDFPFIHLDVDSKLRIPRIAVHLKEGDTPITLPLTLTRFEFLKRVATGALPTSFSRECTEDIRAFKSRLLARLPPLRGGSLKLLHVNEDGMAGSMVLKLGE
jgi:hypothetical protein